MPGAVEPFVVSDTNASHVVIELFGGDNNLSTYVRKDLREITSATPGSFIVLALVDYATTGGQVLEIAPGGDVKVVEELGEIDTGDPETLATFIARALLTFPDVAHRAIGFWDHGSGVFDEHDDNEVVLDRAFRQVSKFHKGRLDNAPRLFVPRAAPVVDQRLRAMLHDDTSGGLLTNVEAAAVIRAAFERAKFVGTVDLIFSDTCLNGMIEVVEQFQSFADVIVGSEDLEPGDGWDYGRLFDAMADRPPTDGASWGRIAVDAFEAGYRDRDDQHPCTLAAIRSQNEITGRFADFVHAATPLGLAGYRMLTGIRGASQGFARRDTYDIRDFASRVAAEADGDLKAAANGLVSAFDDACVKSAALGADVEDARGLAFWFPSDKRSFNKDGGTYRRLDFDRTAHWADYLATYLG